MKKYLYLLLVVMITNSYAVAQNQTVGTLILEDDALDGYTFFSPFSGRNAYMVDNCGNLINQWERGSLPGLAAYFQNDGTVLRTYKVNPVGPFTSASNAGGIEIVDWDNNTIWSYELNTATELSHHDATRLPNGNILLLTWELIQQDELVALGRDPNEIAPAGFVWGERIIEIKPVGDNEGEIIWEWRIKNHFVQDLNANLAGFGIIAENAALFDINLPDINSSNSHSDFDYNHFNAIDYNAGLDQILLSVRNSDEIWILDHSTTTAEAASHEGGNSGMGGDVLYRWGNPSAYQGASISKQRFFGQHGVNWIQEGPDKDKILVYNNGNGRPGTDFSTVEILDPPLNMNGTYDKIDLEPFGPEAVTWKYGEDEGTDRFYSPFLSNAQYLPNGNILINAGSRGEIFEITPEKELVWKYIIPLFGDFAATQGDNINNNATFRAYKFTKAFSGLDEIDIQVGEPIELDPDPVNCNAQTSTSQIVDSPLFEIQNGAATLRFIKLVQGKLNVDCFDLQGRLVHNFSLKEEITDLNTQNLLSGLYFFFATDMEKNKFVMRAAIVH